jgi:hypothetical protein
MSTVEFIAPAGISCIDGIFGGLAVLMLVHSSTIGGLCPADQPRHSSKMPGLIEKLRFG